MTPDASPGHEPPRTMFRGWATRAFSSLTTGIHHQSLQASGVLVVFLLIFFSTPLIKFNDHIYAATDLTQSWNFTHTIPGYVPKNNHLSDTVVFVQPWLLTDREYVSAGKFPLWNPYNGNGAPLLANYQSTFFSFFSIPFYLFSFKTALLIAAFMKLFGIGFFTFLFLKQIGLRQIPALIGATAFMFSGYNVVWLEFTVVGAAIALPGGLYFSERLLGHVSAGGELWPSDPRLRARNLGSLIGLGLCLTAGLLAGHPETFFACFLLLCAYIAFRLFGIWAEGRYGRALLTASLRLGAVLSLAGLLGAALAAVLLIPFAEYVQYGNISRNLAASLFVWPTRAWPMMFYPNLLGSPAVPGMLNVIEQVPRIRNNYLEVNGLYVGGFVCLLAFIALMATAARFGRHNRIILFFWGIGIVWFAYATNIFGVRLLFNAFPGVSFLYYTRSYSIVVFAIVCCAALAVDDLLSISDRLHRRFVAAGVVVAGVILLSAVADNSFRMLQAVSPRLLYRTPADMIARHAEILWGHIDAITISYALGLAACAMLVLSRDRRVRAVLGSLMLLVVFFQSGFLLKDFNPTIDEDLFYPESPGTQYLQDTVKPANVAVICCGIFPANLNVVYKFPMLSNYDTIGVGRYTRLLVSEFDAGNLNQHLHRYSEAGVKLFGVDTIIMGNYPGIEKRFPPARYELLWYNDQSSYSIYRYKDSVPIYHVVYKAVVADSDEQAFNLVQEPGFDPAQEVVLESPDGPLPLQSADPPQSSSESQQIEILSEEPTSIRLKVTQAQAGYLVLTKAYYPGWKATVNGKPETLYHANYAFSAIALQPGENLVEYDYDPVSFKYGLVTTLVSGVILIGVTGYCIYLNVSASGGLARYLPGSAEKSAKNS